MGLGCLNPGRCKCITCTYCSDYFSPNQWYGVICGAVANNINSFANRNVEIGGAWYWWETQTLHTFISNILANWQFVDPTDVTQVNAGTANEAYWYEKRFAIAGSCICTVRYDSTATPGGSLNPADYTAHDILFDEFELELRIIDFCSEEEGKRRIGFWTLHAEASLPSGSGVALEVARGANGTNENLRDCSTYPLVTPAGPLNGGQPDPVEFTVSNASYTLKVQQPTDPSPWGSMKINHSASLTC